MNFFEAAERRGDVIYYSGFVLKELNFVLTPKEFNIKKRLFEEVIFKRVFAEELDYAAARSLERTAGFKVSFFDCLHTVLAKRMNAILITRDRELMEIAGKSDCSVARPEEIRNY